MALFKCRLKTFAGLILKKREDAIPLDKLLEYVHDPPKRGTLWRWCVYGKIHPYNGKTIQMEAIQGTRGLLSSKQAYDRFMEKLNEA